MPTLEDEDLKKREANPDEFEKEFGGDFSDGEKERLNNLSDQVGKGYSPEPGGKKKGIRGRINKKKNKFALWAAGASSGLLLVSILVLILMFSTLKIPQLASHITTWQFARTSRTFRQSMAGVENEKLFLDTANDSLYGAMKDKYGTLREGTWGKLDQYRPKKVVQNMQATGTLDYTYSEPKGIFRRQVLQSVTIAGEEIQVGSNRWYDLVGKYNDRIRISAQLDANLNSALGDTGSIIRGKVASQIRESLGIKLHWWEKLGRNYRGLSDQEADRLATRESYANISNPVDDASTLKPIAEAEENAIKETEACLASPECEDAFLTKAEQTGSTLPDEAIKATDDVLKPGGIEGLGGSIAGVASTAYAVALPLCIIWEGSLEHAAPIVDSQSAALQRTYYEVTTAADQQKPGATTAEAVGAINRQFGDTSQSVPEQRAGGVYVTDPNLTTQTSATGDFTILSAVIGNGAFASIVNTVVGKACPTLTDWRFGIAAGLGELVAGFFSGGGSLTAEEGLKLAVTNYLREVAGSFLSKDTFKVFLREGAAIGATTVAAKLLVLSRMGAQTNGLARGTELANQADAGGNLHANELNRQEFYGKPMTNGEVVASGLQDRRDIAAANASKSTYERYLAIKNPDSLVATLGVGLSNRFSSSQQVLSSIVSLPAQLFSLNNVTKFVSTIFGNSAAHAESSLNSTYGAVQWGWSQEELALLQKDTSYDPLENARILDQSGQMDTIANQYKPCFTETIGKLLAEQKVQRNKDGTVKETEGLCAPSNLGPNNNMVFRYRVFKMYDDSLDHLTGIQDLK